MIRFLLAAALVTAFAAAETPPLRTHQAWNREAVAAYARRDFPAFRAATAAALALRPDSPRYQYHLACALALTGHPPEALTALRQLATLGVILPVATEPDLASLRSAPAFPEILRLLAAHSQPQGRATVAFTLPGLSGIIEGLAHRPATGEIFFGDVRQRCVWRRGPDGAVSRFSSAADHLLGVFNLVVDEARHVLWISTSAVPEIAGYSPALKGQGALCALDLATGRLVRTAALPNDGRNHCLGDLLLAPDSTLYTTDSFAPVVWRLTAGGDHLEPFIESPQFSSLQGLGLLDGGRKMLVTDYANGLFTLTLATKAIAAIPPPPGVTLLGLDGLVVRAGWILAVQNGIEPQRVVGIELTPAADAVTHFRILAAALPGLTDLTLITLIDGTPHVVSQSGWALTADATAKPFPPHDVRVMRIGPG